LAGEIEVLGENLPQCRFVHHKPHMLCPDTKPGRRGGKPVTNLLRYDTVFYAITKGVVLSSEFIGSHSMYMYMCLNKIQFCITAYSS
jgi:hypothetical protein